MVFQEGGFRGKGVLSLRGNENREVLQDFVCMEYGSFLEVIVYFRGDIIENRIGRGQRIEGQQVKGVWRIWFQIVLLEGWCEDNGGFRVNFGMERCLGVEQGVVDFFFSEGQFRVYIWKRLVQNSCCVIRGFRF